MKIPGIIGGIGPESTVEYYRQIIALYRERKPDGSYPPFLINNIDMTRMLDLMDARRFDDVGDYLASEVKKLAAAGADFAVLASNNPHIVFDRIRAGSPIPMISIVEATLKRIQDMGLTRVGLFGTKFTMQGPTYTGVLSKRGIEVATPSPADQDYIHNKYMGELVNGILLDETKQGLLGIVSQLQTESGIQALILGGTELPLMLKDGDIPGFPFLDTTRIHVEAIVTEILTG